MKNFLNDDDIIYGAASKDKTTLDKGYNIGHALKPVSNYFGHNFVNDIA